MLLKDHIKKQRYVPPADAETATTTEPYMIINKNTLTKIDDIYRKKARNKAIKILTKAKKSRAKLKRKADKKLEEIIDDSDAETIQYAEPYRNTFTKKYEIHRKKAKKKALKILMNKRRKKVEIDDDSHGETIQYAEPYRNNFTKKDKIYRQIAKKKC